MSNIICPGCFNNIHLLPDRPEYVSKMFGCGKNCTRIGFQDNYLIVLDSHIFLSSYSFYTYYNSEYYDKHHVVNSVYDNRTNQIVVNSKSNFDASNFAENNIEELLGLSLLKSQKICSKLIFA